MSSQQRNKSKDPPAKPQPSSLVKVLTLAHNLTQFFGWENVLCLTVINLWKDGSLLTDQYQAVDGLRWKLELFQTLQCLDVVFSILGWTNNSVFTTFPQIMSRMWIVFGVFPLITNAYGNYGILLCLLNWSLIEVIRFGYYAIKNVQFLSNSFLSNLFGHFRYNTFIFAYILGVLGELIAIHYAYLSINSLEEKPFTVRMPNKWNFAFDYQCYLMVTPIFYLFGFPQLYMHMWSQRARFYQSLKKSTKSA